MKQKVINEVMQGMLGCLNNVQLERLQEVLEHALFHKQISETEEELNATRTNEQLLESFLAAKRIEGCSEKSLTYYRTTIEAMIVKVKKECPGNENGRFANLFNGISAGGKIPARSRWIISGEYCRASFRGWRMRTIF